VVEDVSRILTCRETWCCESAILAIVRTAEIVGLGSSADFLSLQMVVVSENRYLR